MANSTATQKKPEQPEQPPPAKPMNRRALIVTLGIFLLGGGGAAAWYFLEGDSDAAARPVDQKEKPPVYLPLEAFTVNLQPEAGDQYLQAGLTLKVADPSVMDAVKLRMPEVRSRILLVLSSKRASEISTLTGKQKLSAEILAEVTQVVAPAQHNTASAAPEANGDKDPSVDDAKASKAPSGPITSVLFTSFIIQ